MDKELRIKYTLDTSQADRASRQFHRDEQGRFAASTDSVDSFGKAMMGIAAAQVGVQAVGTVIDAIGSSMKEAADYTKRVAESFGVTRDMMREIAAIQGKGLTNEFVQGQVDLAKKSKILTPQEMTQGQLSFQQFGSAYIGDGPGSRISQGQVDELLPTFGGLAKATGVEQGAVMQMFAKTVQALPAHSSTEKYKETFAKMMEMAKGSSGSATLTAKSLAPFMSTSVGEGMAFEPTEQGVLDATKTIAAISEVNPVEAGSYATGAVNIIEELTQSKGSQIGMSDDQTFMQKIQLLSDLYKKEGKGMKFPTWLRKVMGRKGTIQGVKGIQALVQKGIGENFFGTMDKMAGDASAEKVDADIEKHLGTNQGRADIQKSQDAIADAEVGKSWDPVQALVEEASTSLKQEGEFEKSHPFYEMMSKLPGGAGSGQKQMINSRAMSMAQQRAADAGVDAYAGPDSVGRALTGVGDPELVQRQEMKRLLELTERQTKAIERMAGGNVPNPMNVKPPVPAMR